MILDCLGKAALLMRKQCFQRVPLVAGDPLAEPAQTDTILDMKFKLLLMALVIAAAPALHAAVIVTLPPDTANYAGGVTAPGGASQGGTTQANGLTFNITFTPTGADLTGLVTLMEIGGQTNGTALYLLDGVPVFLSKTGGGSVYTIPDTTFDDGSGIAVAHSGGSLSAAVQTTVAAIYDPGSGDLSLAVGSAPVTDTFSITDPRSNWNGNNSLSVGLRSVNGGDRAGTFPAAGTFNQDLQSLAGTIDGDAYYWNSSAATVIPEPSTALLGALGALALLRRRRA